MKRKLLLLPLFLLVLAACGTTTSSEPGTSTPGTSTPGTSVPTSTPTSEEPTLPPPPSTSEIPAPESMTIAQIRAITLNATGGLDAGQIKEVRTTGTVTTVSRSASGPSYNVTIQDGEKAMLLYAITEDKIADFGQPGDFLTVDGTLAPYKGLWELSGVKVVSKVTGTAVTPKGMTSLAQAPYVGLDSVLVTIPGVSIIAGEIVADTSADNLTFKLGDNTMGGYLHYAIPQDVQAAIAAALVPTGDIDGKIDAMDTFTFTGVVGMNAGTYQLSITGPENFTNVVDGGEPVAPTVYSSIIDIRAGIKAGTIAAGALVNFEGVVTSKDNYNTQYANGDLTIQSTVGGNVKGIYAYRVPGAIYDAVAVGNLVRGQATVGVYKGLFQLASPFSTTFEVVEAVGPAQGAVELTEALIADANFADATGALVTATGLTATADVVATAGADLTLTLGKGAQTVDLFANKFFTNHADVIAKLNLIKAGYSVELLQGAAYLGWRDTERVMLLDATKIVVRDLQGAIVGEAPVVTPKVKAGITSLFAGKAIDDVVTITEGYVLWNRFADTAMIVATPEGTASISYFSLDATAKATFESIVKGDYVNMTLKLAANGTGGNFARAMIGIPQVVETSLFVKVSEPAWNFDGMNEATNVYDLTQGLNWLATYGTADLGTYVRVTGKVVEAATGNQFYLEFNSRVDGMNAIGTGTNYIRLSAYKADLLGFTLVVNSTYTIEGIIGGVNQNLPLTGTANPIFRLYAQSVVEVVL